MVNLLVENEAEAFVPSTPIASIEEVTGRVSPEARRFYAEGISLSEQGNHELALEAYEQSLLHDRQNPQAWYNKGTTLGFLARYSESLQALEQAIRLNDEYFEAWHNKGVALGRLHKVEDAIESFEQALKLNPTNSGTWLSKGIALLARQELEEAHSALEQALVHEVSNPQIWMFLGVALACKSLFSDAHTAFQKAFSLEQVSLEGDGYLYKAWATTALAWGIDALASNDINGFERAGNNYLDVWDKAESENAGSIGEVCF